MGWFHKVLSKFMKSVLYTNPFVDKRIINMNNETFKKQAVIISNHTSFLDILAIGMLHPKIIFLVNDWVYNSPFFKTIVKKADYFRASDGYEKCIPALNELVKQGYSILILLTFSLLLLFLDKYRPSIFVNNRKLTFIFFNKYIWSI